MTFLESNAWGHGLATVAADGTILDVLYPDPRDHEGYWGGFTEEQMQFIENDLKTVPKHLKYKRKDLGNR